MRTSTEFLTTWTLAAVCAAALAGGAAAQGQPDPSAAVQSAAAPSAARKPGTVFRDCSDCPEMVVVPAGKFVMGWDGGDRGERPAHEVVIAKPFAIGKFEVTFDDWDACVAGGGCVSNKEPIDHEWGRGRRPVIYVTWRHVHEYLDWLSAKTGEKYRLLTEAEWEYAARAGTTTKYAFGDTITHDQANFSLGQQGKGHTVEVGSYPPNPWGLYDMHGNVWEWTQDCYEDTYEEAPVDGTARVSPGCPVRSLRGGSWDYVAEENRSSIRFWLKPAMMLPELGFRLARSLE